MSMAKGWESKSVEDQIQENQTTDKDSRRKQLTAQQMETHRRREVLLLSRARVEKELNSSQNARYKEQLTRALSDLDAQLSQLEQE
jgi:hypothetical protein